MGKVLSLREIREVRREYDRDPQATCDYFRELLETKQIKAKDLSIRDLFVGLVEDGEEVIRQFDPRQGGKRGINLVEDGGAVGTAAFANLTGQMTFSVIMDEYQIENDIAEQLCETVPTRFNGERIPGVGGIGDEAETVDEGQDYPTAGPNEQYIETPQTTKKGMIVPVTKEIVFFDRTNVLLQRCAEVGKWLGVHKLKQVLGTLFGLTINGVNYNTYRRNGVAFNTYLTSGAYVNSMTGNPLIDWTSVQSAEIKMAALLDPNTGQPITVEPTTLVVPVALKHTARRITTATEVRTNYPGYTSTANPPAPGNVQQITGNPVDGYEVVSSRWISFLTGSSTKWWFGAPKRAVKFLENWPLTVVQAPSNSEAEFTQDVVQRYKASYRGFPAVVEPRFMFQSDQ